MDAGLEHTGCTTSCQTSPDRHPRAQPFRKAHYIRKDARVLMGEPLAGATDSTLHFIDHEQPVFLITNPPQRAHEFHMHGMNAALALHRLKQHRDDIRIALRNMFDCCDIVESDAHKSGHQRFKSGLHLAISSGGQCCQRTAMERMFHNDNRRLIDALLVTVVTRKLDRGLVGFATGVAEKHLIHF